MVLIAVKSAGSLKIDRSVSVHRRFITNYSEKGQHLYELLKDTSSEELQELSPKLESAFHILIEAFNAKFLLKSHRTFGTKAQFTKTYNPKAKGQTEGLNRIIPASIRRYTA
eukprot:IDg5591t1